jgi:hypothetical protein
MFRTMKSARASFARLWFSIAACFCRKRVITTRMKKGSKKTKHRYLQAFDDIGMF